MKYGLSPIVLAFCGSLAAAEVTFSRDVAPILWKNCAGCHRPGEVGPFPLFTFEDAAKRTNFLRHITRTRRMPPWRPVPGFGGFSGIRRLSDADVKTLDKWARAGAPEGDRKDLPPVPRFVDNWQRGEPDLILRMPDAFPLPADGPDLYRCFVIPIPLGSDQTVAAVEFRPGNRRVVFHAELYLDEAGLARKKDRTDGKPGYASFSHPGIRPSGHLGSWVPGAGAQVFPERTGVSLKKGSDLVLQVHYHPIGKEQTDQSAVGLYFSKKPTRQFVTTFRVEGRQLDIPAGKQDHAANARSDPLAIDLQALSISPHMHYLGREIKVTAHLPDRRVFPLVWIKDWDFHWQETYRFVKPVSLPKGTVIELTGIFDNSADNPQNPSDPPQRVRWGERATDEMLLCSMQVLAYTPVLPVEVPGKPVSESNAQIPKGDLLSHAPLQGVRPVWDYTIFLWVVGALAGGLFFWYRTTRRK